MNEHTPENVPTFVKFAIKLLYKSVLLPTTSLLTTKGSLICYSILYLVA